jgi:hypothetical protein
MTRDIDDITKEMDALSRNIDVWQELVAVQLREKVVPVDKINLYQELINKAFLVVDALIIEKEAHPNFQNSNNDDEVKHLPIEKTNEEFAAIRIEPASNLEPATNLETVKDPVEMVGGKRQKKRKSKKQMKKRKSGKKTRRSKK